MVHLSLVRLMETFHFRISRSEQNNQSRGIKHVKIQSHSKTRIYSPLQEYHCRHGTSERKYIPEQCKFLNNFKIMVYVFANFRFTKYTHSSDFLCVIKWRLFEIVCIKLDGSFSSLSTDLKTRQYGKLKATGGVINFLFCSTVVYYSM
jgi:hypothetical protein